MSKHRKVLFAYDGHMVLVKSKNEYYSNLYNELMRRYLLLGDEVSL